jgi:hypothetical protein
MVTKARNLWHRLAYVKLCVPLLSADEQTRLSWARVARSWDEVLEVFREPRAAAAGGSGGLPYTVLTPSFQGFLLRPSEKLICACGRDRPPAQRRAAHDAKSRCDLSTWLSDRLSGCEG